MIDNKFLKNKNFGIQKYFIIWLTIIIIFGLNPYDRLAWFLDFIFVLLFFYFLFIWRDKFQFSDISMIFITILIFINSIGFYFGVENVPIDFFINFFNLSRNPYDRILHFSFGLLAFLPITEILKFKFKKNKSIFPFFIAFFVIAGIGAIYEVVEWLFSGIAPVGSAEIYLGFQGDKWDTQKDLLVMLIGSLIALIFCSLKFCIKNDKKIDS